MTGSDDHIIIDRPLLRRRLARARSRKSEAPHPLIARIGEDIAGRLDLILRKFPRTIAITPDEDDLVRKLAKHPNLTDVIHATIAQSKADEGTPPRQCPVVLIDDEMQPFHRSSIDLIVSVLTLQAANDLPGVLLQSCRALRPDGLFIGVLMAGRSLHELRTSFLLAEGECENGASPHVVPFADVRELGGLMQRAGFALPVADTDTITLTYPDPFALMTELRTNGAANPLVARKKSLSRRETMMRAAEIYRERFAMPDGRIPATLELVTLTGWSPHESQPQPLKPGSAKTRLAEALDTKEYPTDDRVNPSRARK